MTDRLEYLIAEAKAGLRHFYGGQPDAVSAAPGRVNLMGDHVDYAGGPCLPVAIDRHTVVAIRANGTNTMRVRSANEDRAVRVPISNSGDFTGGLPGWEQYIRGVLHQFAATHKVILPGFFAYIASDIPVGMGLASSASLEVAFYTALEGLMGVNTDSMVKVKDCIKAEHDFAGVPCGIMDQMSAVYSAPNYATHIDCSTEEFTPVALPDDLAIIVGCTNVKHNLAQSEYSSLRGMATSKDEVDGLRFIPTEETMRVRQHVAFESDLVGEVVDALTPCDPVALGIALHASHKSLKGIGVSCRELDEMVNAQRALEGSYGGRMQGGGFGGSTVTLAKGDRAADVIAAMTVRYRDIVGDNFDIFLTKTVGGAKLWT